MFDPVEGTSLTLADSLIERLPSGQEHELDGGVRGRILGVINDGEVLQPVTLIDCIWSARRKYRPNSFLIGGHFATDEETEFESVIVRLRDAAPWVNQEAGRFSRS
ncbi:hypothetical protein [Winogradskya consettensis]|uniref:ApeA N-terminal domain 1-containing protein n=1 Tax=Winogradskya consettensis TaxID=113560 RepID=UPI001BB38F06|nr:hypothetical protein [Actinoplanes consettensis]